MRTTKRSKSLFYKICAITLMAIMGGCSSTSASDSSEQKYKQLTTPLLLGQLTKIYGVRKQGHGPYVWFELPDQKIELWAFYMPIKDKRLEDSQALDDFQINKRLDDFQVMFLTEVEKNKEDNAKVVWPKQYVGQSVEQVYKVVYKSIAE